ncbi:DUF192 domain-containing protein [Candidatus Wolfebacteria bacterium]|nr:DUF192 domain-containing protein [Candidatus Wolfebacteria bacterium]
MANYSTIFLIVLFVAAVVGFILFKGKQDYEISKIEINGKVFEVEIADTILKKTKGLSGRKCLKNDEGICPESAEGMLFLFSSPSKRSFWMKDMKFALDIIWINNDRIVDISKNVPSPKGGESPSVVSPSEVADKVLEMAAGSAEKFGIKIGDRLLKTLK